MNRDSIIVVCFIIGIVLTVINLPLILFGMTETAFLVMCIQAVTVGVMVGTAGRF